MFTSKERGIQKQAHVDFTRSGWRKFMRLNRSLGVRFLRGFVLRYELAAYLTAHEAAGVELDEGCQEVCYENGVYLLLRKMQGVWYITDICSSGTYSLFAAKTASRMDGQNRDESFTFFGRRPDGPLHLPAAADFPPSPAQSP